MTWLPAFRSAFVRFKVSRYRSPRVFPPRAVLNSVTIIRETPWASIPVTAVVLKYSLCFWVVPVHGQALNPPLPSVTHFVMYVCLALFVPSTEGFCGASALSPGQSMTIFPWAQLWACRRKLQDFVKRAGMSACIRFRELCNILDDEGVPLVNTDCQNVLQVGRRVPSKTPYGFPTCLAHRLIDSDPEPI